MDERYDQNMNGNSAERDYSYENYSGSSESSQSSEYTGGGSYYQYNSTGNSYYNTETSESSGNSGNYSDNYYQGGSGSDGPGSGKKGKGKAVLVVVLALIFGLCAGVGTWGVHRYLSSASAIEASATVREQEPEAVPEAEVNEPEQAPEEAPPAEEEARNVEPEQPAEAAAEQAPEPETQTAAQPQTSTADAGLIISDSDSSGRETQITKVVDKVMPSIVSVYNSYTEQINFFGQIYSQEAEATGSGIIIGKTDDKLLMVTNHHVVSGADQLRVLFYDGESYEAEIIGTDSTNDLAVISVNLKDLSQSTLDQVKIATLGNSDKVKVGEQAIAIGNALGYGQSVTNGIVSATEREISSEEGITGTFIQTDAAINPGNSGGALVNADGEVIGINSSKIGGNSIEGMGFAIPISRAIPIIQQLISQDSIPKVAEDKQGTIGISGQSVTADVANAYGMPQGVYVFQILENGGAASSDLQVGDVITAINGVTVSTMEDLQRQLQYYEAGTKVTLTVQRQDKSRNYQEMSIDVTLGSKESINSAQSSQQQESVPGQNGAEGRQGEGREREENNGGYGSGSGYGFPFGY